MLLKQFPSFRKRYNRIMRLSGLQTIQGLYTLFELPHQVRLANHLSLDIGVRENQVFLDQVANQMLQAAGNHISGLALDSEAGLQAFLEFTSTLRPGRAAVLGNAPQTPGILLRIDTPNFQARPSDLPHFSQDWGVENIRNNYGVALLELQYHPNEEFALQKKQIVAEIGDFCVNQAIDFVLKLVVPASSEAGTATGNSQEAQLTAVQELRSYCQLLALHPPTDALAAATLTAELDIPWIALSDQPSDYLSFKNVLKLALDNGAQGYLASDLIWQDIGQLRRADQGIDQAQLQQFVGVEVPKRLIDLSQIVNETVKV